MGVDRLAALTGLCLLLLAGAAAGQSRNGPPTVYMTWNGRPGVWPGSNTPVTALLWDATSFDTLKDGTVVQLLPAADDSSPPHPFTGRVVISRKRDIVIRGLGASTVVSGKGYESFQCEPPAQDRYGCEGKSIPLAPPSADAPSDLSDQIADGLIQAQNASGPEMLAGSSLSGIPGTSATEAVQFETDKERLTGPLAVPPTGNNLRDAACIDLDNVDGATFEDMTFRNCWLTAIRAVDSRNIVLRSTTIVGGSYGLVVATETKQADTVTVEDVHWIEDDSSYDPKTGRCRETLAWGAGCPGKMWRQIPWGSSHHGTYIHFNGALFYGKYVDGPVVFRRNTVENAFNGIRLKSRPCVSKQACTVWVYDNLFAYVRDNPVEFEKWIKNAYVFGNRFYNAHAWLSVDEAGGGPVYFFGNRGWFDDMPETKWSDAITTDTCAWKGDYKANGKMFDSRFDRAFDYSAGAWYPTGIEEYDKSGTPTWESPAEMECGNTTGRAIKIGMADDMKRKEPKGEDFDSYVYMRDAPLYVFNNSWYLRAPVTGIGMAMNLRHWNNAILFCEPGTPGYDSKLCAEPPKLSGRVPNCDRYGLVRHPAQQGKIPFFDCFRWKAIDSNGDEIAGQLPNDFNYDVSSNGFPLDLDRDVKIELGRGDPKPEDPGFEAPQRGDFTLAQGAAAANSPCAIIEGKKDVLSCVKPEDDPHVPRHPFAGAFAPDGTLYRGPPGWRIPPG